MKQFTHTRPNTNATVIQLAKHTNYYMTHKIIVKQSQLPLLYSIKIKLVLLGGVFAGVFITVILLQLCFYCYSTFHKRQQENRERSRIIKERIHPVDYYYRKRIRNEFDSNFSLESSNGLDSSDLPTESNRQNKSYAEFFQDLEKNHLHQYKTYNKFVDDLENIHEYKTYNEFIQEQEKGSLSRQSSIESDYTFDLSRNDGYI